MDTGTIALDGQEFRPSTPQAAIEMGISTVFQEVNLCPNLTVAENISSAASRCGAGRSTGRRSTPARPS